MMRIQQQSSSKKTNSFQQSPKLRGNSVNPSDDTAHAHVHVHASLRRPIKGEQRRRESATKCGKIIKSLQTHPPTVEKLLITFMKLYIVAASLQVLSVWKPTFEEEEEAACMEWL